MIGYKVFTHDLRPPIRGGEPVWDGAVPYELQPVSLDTSDRECGEGWNFCRGAGEALRIAGLWPDGWSSRLFVVEPIGDVVERGDKCRASSLRIVEEITDLRPAICELSEPFGDLRDEMVNEQLAWREALARPKRDATAVEAGLRRALEARGLDWELKRFKNARAACDARAAWTARAAWDIGDAWDAWDAWTARAAWDIGDAWDAWDAWTARAAWVARAAWTAIAAHYASHCGWVTHPGGFLTVGIRGAYRNGLAIALPTGPGELGWAMENGE